MDSSRYGSLVLAGLLAAGLLVVSRSRQRDAEFGRRAFIKLSDGNQRVQPDIAWEKLVALNADVGETYRHLPDAKERALFRQAFVREFAKGFLQEGGQLHMLRNWRTIERGKEMVLVAADLMDSGQRLALGVSRRGKRRIELIRWE